MILSCPQVKTHLQAQAKSEIAVGHQYKHQVRVPQTTGVPNHLPHFLPAFCLYLEAPALLCPTPSSPTRQALEPILTLMYPCPSNLHTPFPAPFSWPANALTSMLPA